MELLSAEHLDEIVDVLADAFYDYPVMRWVLGPTPPYDERLRRLITFFVSGRILRHETIFGVREAGGSLVAVATTTRPDSPPAPSALIELREATWATLGSGARARYEAFAAAGQTVPLPEPHYHLNMIGVRRAQQGTGLGRLLLDALHAHAEKDPRSAGVSLTTERESNVRLYQHVGYRVAGQVPVSEALTTWIMFRPRRPNREGEDHPQAQ
ncbi:MAG TPA: GNAT family N-acetyltransferase [Gemmatimonadaceae bacterium]